MNMRLAILLTAATLGLVATDVLADAQSAQARYLANAGVMIERGDTKILFDPLFRNGYNRYQLVPVDIEQALFSGEPPWDSVDAIFISHFHGDHFSPRVMLDFLEARADIRLFAPRQAVSALATAGASAEVLERVTEVELSYGDEPVSLEFEDLTIEAVRVPHSGWPDNMADIENIAWRVTIDDETTVVHLGDADTKPLHYELHPDHWRGVDTDLALPPYWYFLSPRGRIVLDEHIRPDHAIGVHVPSVVPAEFSDSSDDEYDLFTTPGETREIPDD